MRKGIEMGGSSPSECDPTYKNKRRVGTILSVEKWVLRTEEWRESWIDGLWERLLLDVSYRSEDRYQTNGKESLYELSIIRMC